MDIVEGLFLQILNMSITGSVVILAIILFRFALKKAPKYFSYTLWSVAAFRLISPISFASVISLFNFRLSSTTSVNSAIPNALTHIPSDIGQMPIPQVSSGISAADKIINRSLPAANATASVNPIQVWITIAAVIWLTVLIILLVYSIVSYIRVTRMVTNAVRLEGNIFETDRISSPFVIGFFKPRIYLPFHVRDAERNYILRHEQHHIRRYDHLIKPFSFLILMVYWFNPFVWVAYYLMDRDMEMSCDEAVLSKMGLAIKKEYSSSLLSLASRYQFPAASPLSFSESNVKGRVMNVLNFKKPKTGVMMSALITCLLVFVVCASNPIVSAKSFPFDPTANTDTVIDQSILTKILSIPYSSKVVGMTGMDGEGGEEDTGPASFYITDDQHIYILDTNNHQILQFFNGALLKTIKVDTEGYMTDIAMTNEHIFVLLGDDSILKMDHDGFIIEIISTVKYVRSEENGGRGLTFKADRIDFEDGCLKVTFEDGNVYNLTDPNAAVENMSTGIGGDGFAAIISDNKAINFPSFARPIASYKAATTEEFDVYYTSEMDFSAGQVTSDRRLYFTADGEIVKYVQLEQPQFSLPNRQYRVAKDGYVYQMITTADSLHIVRLSSLYDYLAKPSYVEALNE